MKKYHIAIIFVALGLFAGCSEQTSKEATTNAAEEQMLVGGDTDKHGCKAAAGYAWCSKTNQCERPWELAKSQQFDNTPEGFTAFCANDTKD